MRIALLTYSSKPRGGVVHTLALAEALAALGQDVTVWTLGRGGDDRFYRAVDPAVTTRIVPFPSVDDLGERVLRSIAMLREAFDPSGYDIVHAQDCISANAVDRCIRTVHHIDHFTTPELAACHERAIVRPYRHICVSAAVAAELRVGWGISATVIPNGVNYDRFAGADGRAWRERLGSYVLSVGGIEPRKGSLDLLEAYRRLGRPDVRLVIAGGETLFDYRSYRAEWDALAASLRPQPVVLGPVDDDELPALVAGASVFAFPSTKEGFGLAAMEALAAGVPLVARDLPVLREVFAGAARFAASVPDLAAALGSALDSGGGDRVDAGRRLAAGYRWSAAAEAHLRLYQEVLDGRDQGPMVPAATPE
ncbi:MSMEG_0565 family glycosyltransferase [Kutzneria sp. NPDC052558]|uniref:MSMEG_0565 family glycosyltransferase n=1 Tax=Kutzneria sp. NPDC052558 TaxID=3364121 RepID=UPI0037C98618